MPGGAEAVGVRFDLIYPVQFNAFVLTTTGDGLGPIIRYETDFLLDIVYQRMYYQSRSILSGAIRPDSNQEYDLVTFAVEFFFWLGINGGSPHQGDNAKEFPFWGGLFAPPGALNDKIEPLMDPLWWTSPPPGEDFNNGFIHGMTREPEYTIEPERINQVTAHCEISVELIVEEVVP